MLLATLAILFIVLAILAALTAACAFAALTFIVGLALRSSRYQWLSPFLIWIPSLAAAFAVSFTAYSFFALTRSWSFPENPLEYFIGLILGEMLSIGVGFAIAFRTKKRKQGEGVHAT